MSRTDAHAEVAQLLPWFVNGTLSVDEHARVERHVRECLSCYSTLQQERRLRELVSSQSTASMSAELGFDRLMSQIEGTGRGRGPRRARAARWPAAVAAGLVALAAGTLVWLGVAGPGAGSGPYATATRSEAQAGPLLDVVFAESLPAAEARELLADIDATVVEGPTDVGRYTVRVDAASSDAELTALIERLRRDERVRFAGRSYTGRGEP